MGGFTANFIHCKKKWVWHPEFEPQNRKPGKSAPVTPCECRAEHAPPICGILRRTRPSSNFTCGGVQWRNRVGFLLLGSAANGESLLCPVAENYATSAGAGVGLDRRVVVTLHFACTTAGAPGGGGVFRNVPGRSARTHERTRSLGARWHISPEGTFYRPGSAPSISGRRSPHSHQYWAMQRSLAADRGHMRRLYRSFGETQAPAGQLARVVRDLMAMTMVTADAYLAQQSWPRSSSARACSGDCSSVRSHPFVWS